MSYRYSYICGVKILVIQTAFIGDVILATPVAEALRRAHPDARIDLLVRSGCERLFEGHPFVGKVWVWQKKARKYANLLRLIRQLRRERYDWAINCQRFAASGLLTIACGARHTVGFDKNPLSLFFQKKSRIASGKGMRRSAIWPWSPTLRLNRFGRRVPVFIRRNNTLKSLERGGEAPLW